GKFELGPDQRQGIWLSGALPQRRTVRGDGPLHGLRVKLSGKFHWEPKRGAGHMGLWRAWLGVKSCDVIDSTAELGAAPDDGPAKRSGDAEVTDGPPSVR